MACGGCCALCVGRPAVRDALGGASTRSSCEARPRVGRSALRAWASFAMGLLQINEVHGDGIFVRPLRRVTRGLLSPAHLIRLPPSLTWANAQSPTPALRASLTFARCPWVGGGLLRDFSSRPCATPWPPYAFKRQHARRLLCSAAAASDAPPLLPAPRLWKGGGEAALPARERAHKYKTTLCPLLPRPSLFALAAPSRRFQRATRGRDVELGGVRGHWLAPLKDALLAAAAAAPAAAKKVAGQQNFLRRERPRLPLRGLRAPLAARLARRAASAPSAAAAAAAAATAAAAALAPLRSGHHCAFVAQKRCARREGRSRLAPRGRRENCEPVFVPPRRLRGAAPGGVVRGAPGGARRA
jgi:hypothetical protein